MDQRFYSQRSTETESSLAPRYRYSTTGPVQGRFKSGTQKCSLVRKRCNMAKLLLFLSLLLLANLCESYKSLRSPALRSNSPNYIKNEEKRSYTVLTASTVGVAAGASNSITFAALSAVSKLLSTCGIGVWASKVGILDKSAMSVLSKLIFNLLQPCLLFVNVASTCAKLKESGSAAAVALLPIAAAVQILLGFIIGKVVSLFLYGNKSTEESKMLLTCTTFGNSGPLPLTFVDALLRNHVNSAHLPKSIGYISLYLLGWSPLFWIFAPAILSDDSNSKTDWKVVQSRVLSPPVLGSIFGVIVGSLPFLRSIFISPTGFLNPIFESMRTLGAGYLPAVLLVLAGSLLPSPDASGATEKAATTANDSKIDIGYIKQIVAIYLARFLLIPTAGFAIIKALKTRVPALSSILSDPILVFVLLLETAMPSAQNSTVILQLQKKSAAAARVARILLAIYVLGVPAISYWLIKILKYSNL